MPALSLNYMPMVSPILRFYQNTLNNVRILRNQLTRISTDFNYTILGNSGFSVTINPDWDGTNNDDETIIP